MTKDEFVLSIKRSAAAFGSDGPDIGDGSAREWAAAYEGWMVQLAKVEVDTKRAGKARKEAADTRARAEAAGIALVGGEQVVDQYDTALANAEARAAAAEGKVADLEAELEELRGKGK